jgi:bifunctional polynucleotide phosphatase/kinase
MRWNIICNNNFTTKIGFVYGTSNNYLKSSNSPLISRKIASFDLDQTLIKTTSGKKFPINSDDWEWNYSNVRQLLHDYHNKKYEIIIITNQAGIKDSETKLNEFKTKIEKIEADIGDMFHFEIYCMIYKDVYRKPFPTIFDKLIIDRNNSFYCGDACGRKNDHSDTDIKFAYNTRLKFRTPENVFENKVNDISNLTYPLVPLFKKFMQNKSYVTNITTVSGNTYVYENNNKNKPEIILMVGLPASGKSHVANIIKNVCDNELYLNFILISLDILKTKAKMFKLIKQYSAQKFHILIDNTNLESVTRNEIISMVKLIDTNYFVRIIHINTPIEICLHNNCYRLYRDYMINPKYIPEFVYNMMKKKYVVPELSENKLIDKIDTLSPGIPLEISYFYYYY